MPRAIACTLALLLRLRLVILKVVPMVMHASAWGMASSGASGVAPDAGPSERLASDGFPGTLLFMCIRVALLLLPFACARRRSDVSFVQTLAPV